MGCHVQLESVNGESITVEDHGLIHVIKPQVTREPLSAVEANRFFALSLGGSKLKLGKDDGSGEGFMRFRITVQALEDEEPWGQRIGRAGFANLTQVLENYETPYFHKVNALDGSEFYNASGDGGPGDSPVSVGVGGDITFQDGPESIQFFTVTGENYVLGSFKIYVRFRPDRAGAIWATLATLTWDCAGVAEISLGTTWHITEDFHPDPLGPTPSEAFPVYEGAFSTH